MKKLICVILLLSLLLLVNGCNNTNSTEATSKGEEQNTGIQKHPSNQSDTSSKVNQEESPNVIPTNKDQFIITNSVEHGDWKELSAKVSLSEMICDGDSRGSTNLVGDTMIEYSILFPSSWTLKDTVFEDSNDNKVAEIAPVVLLKQGEEAEFLDYKTSEGNILTKESISVTEYKGTKVVLQVGTEVGSWYPHMYMISDGTFGFTITVYSHNLIRDEVEEKLFDDIVKTFRFKQ